MAKKAKKKEKEIISKTMLIDKVAAVTEGISKKDIGAVIAATLETIKTSVGEGDEVPPRPSPCPPSGRRSAGS